MCGRGLGLGLGVGVSVGMCVCVCVCVCVLYTCVRIHGTLHAVPGGGDARASFLFYSFFF